MMDQSSLLNIILSITTKQTQQTCKRLQEERGLLETRERKLMIESGILFFSVFYLEYIFLLNQSNVECKKGEGQGLRRESYNIEMMTSGNMRSLPC